MIFPKPSSPGSNLRALVNKGTVVLPGVYDAITARVAENCGAQALYLSGAGVTNSMTAMPDIALISQDEMSRQANYVCNAVSIPVIADADTGYGEALNVFRTIKEFERSGLAGCHLEDQVSPKRCGHLDGKQVIDIETMCTKIRSACSARNDNNFFITARTDARGVTGMEDAINRSNAYVQAGADCIFPEGLANRAEFESFRKHVPGPLLANMTEFGKTELISVSEFESLGYQIVIFPMTAFRMMLTAVKNTYRELLSKGTQKEILDQMTTRKELYELIDYAKYESMDKSFE